MSDTQSSPLGVFNYVLISACGISIGINAEDFLLDTRAERRERERDLLINHLHSVVAVKIFSFSLFVRK